MELKEALVSAKIKIIKYDPLKQRALSTSLGPMDIRKFSGVLLEKLGSDMLKFPEVVKAAHDPHKMGDMLKEYTEETGTLVSSDTEIVIPEELQEYTLNANIIAKKGEDDFFLTTKDEFMSRITGKYYINRCCIPPPEAYRRARAVIPEYRPRHRAGVFEEENSQTKEKEKIFNSYIPPDWVLWGKENRMEWSRLPSRPPTLFLKLIQHLIPDPEERKYFYAWLYASLTVRSYVYLVLCGAPGAGKNRLKLVLRALHGRDNTNDGKKSTLDNRFNSQLSTGTLTWFDELHYTLEMENVMKEIQNDYISVERKGVDATRSSTIHSSMVISNNKPRDNYIAFDARKFAPLDLGKKDLRHSMTEKEIDTLSRKVEMGKPDFDIKFVAQIAKWILSIGQKNLKKYPTLEYRGPMFWTLAHTSMTRWQKKAITTLVDKKTGNRVGWDINENAHLWSKVEEKITKRSGENSMMFPDYSSVKAFFDIFRDGSGQKAFDTGLVPGSNILGDFWIYPLVDHVDIITESTVAQQREKGKQSGKTKIYDL